LAFLKKHLKTHHFTCAFQCHHTIFPSGISRSQKVGEGQVWGQRKCSGAKTRGVSPMQGTSLIYTISQMIFTEIRTSRRGSEESLTKNLPVFQVDFEV